MTSTEEVAFSVVCMLAAIGVYHLATTLLRREAQTAVATYDRWLRALEEALHELIDADIRCAQLEARVMDLCGKVPAETSYQAIRRLGLGRAVEKAILGRLELAGLGKALPTEEADVPAPSAGTVSRRAGLAAPVVGDGR